MSHGAIDTLVETRVLPLSQRVRDVSVARWGPDRAVDLIGTSPAFLTMLTRIEKIARYREPILITGESGVGKELVAQALSLLGQPAGRPYVSVNCPQFQEGNLTVSELFGHQKGSFTGAFADHTGAFEEAHGGTIFLDEIADLHAGAQALLLRALATGEFRPIGATRPRSVEVRVIAATNRPLNQLMFCGEFRKDLFFRLRHFHVDVPALRARGDDWRLLFDHMLQRLGRKYGVERRLSPRAEAQLAQYAWPGNVRQLMGVAASGYAMADGALIEPDDFASQLDDEDPAVLAAAPAASAAAPATPATATTSDDVFEDVVTRGHDFWSRVYEQFMRRNLNRTEVRHVIRRGLQSAHGSYRRLLDLLRLPGSDYQRFMDFLRHHDLKP